MDKLGYLSDTVVLSDFDGTITTFDTNVELFNRLVDHEVIEDLRRKYYSGKISIKELQKQFFKGIHLSQEQYLNYILNDVKLQKGFSSFYNFLREKNIPFAVVSGGFETGIKPFLKKHGFEDIPIYANWLIFDGERVKPKFYDEKHFPHIIDTDHYVDCKVEILKDYRERYDNVIFLGDGVTDIHVADKVDILFAKDYLEKYCVENCMDYIPWENFYDIIEWFKG
ncbi:MAG TPA: MtnX-like HAD-IB family phosphatase [Tepidimicrobium sp.]|nr:MtnX-like HAD-IB family phosphatase [Tepidimicrobium sp.]